MIQLGKHFRGDDQSRHSQWLRQQKWFVKARQEQDRKEDIADKLEEEILAFAIDAVLATELQIEKFKTKLDAYDEATVKALMENQGKLDDIIRRLSEVEMRLQDMLDRAYVMEDGRRVFLTKDRTQAFDEHGTEITHDELDFGLVPKSNPTWESRSGAVVEQDKLLSEYKDVSIERQEILKFQEKADTARERVADGKITKSELDDLDTDLSDAMPPSVKSHLPGYDTAENAPNAKSAFTAHANSTDIAPIAIPQQAPSFDPV